MCNVERMNELKIMEKTLRYLLIVMVMVSFLGANAQGLAQQPEAQMHSTSVMVGTGSSLPQAASTGTYTTGTTPGTYSPASFSGSKRATMDDNDDDGWEDEDEPDKPGEPFPIGDAAWPLMLLALAFAIGKWLARTKPLR